MLPDLFGDSYPWVFGWRPSRRKPKPGVYNDNGGEWSRLQPYLQQCSESFPVALKADVTQFFPSIDLARMDHKVKNHTQKSGRAHVFSAT